MATILELLDKIGSLERELAIEREKNHSLSVAIKIISQKTVARRHEARLEERDVPWLAGEDGPHK